MQVDPVLGIVQAAEEDDEEAKKSATVGSKE
jgi:hypothetical protein